MSSIERKMAESDAGFTTPLARLCCRLGVLAILFSIFILLSWVNLNFAHTWSINFTWLCYIVLIVYYYFIDVKLGIVSTVVMFIFTLIATLIGGHQPSWVSIILFLIFFVGGVASVLIGYYVLEKRQGSLINNFQESLITPLFVIVECLQRSGFGATFGVSDTRTTEHTHDQQANDHSDDHESK